MADRHNECWIRFRKALECKGDWNDDRSTTVAEEEEEVRGTSSEIGSIIGGSLAVCVGVGASIYMEHVLGMGIFHAQAVEYNGRVEEEEDNVDPSLHRKDGESQAPRFS